MSFGRFSFGRRSFGAAPAVASTAPSAIAGTAAATSGASGTLVGIGALAGASVATTGATATLLGLAALIGSADATSSAAGTVIAGGALSGVSAATSGATATLSATGALAGSSAATSGAVGTLANIGITIAEISGTAAATSGASGTLTARPSVTLGPSGLIIARLRAECPMFTGRVAGAMDFSLARDADAFPAPHGFVILRGISPSGEDQLSDLDQEVSVNLSVMVAVASDGDETGQDAGEQFIDAFVEVRDALLGWSPAATVYGPILMDGISLAEDETYTRARAWARIDIATSATVNSVI